MGIYKFSQYFVSNAIDSTIRSFQVVAIDANLFWERLLSSYKNVEEEGKFYTIVFNYICKTLLQQQLRADICQLKNVKFIFDNKWQRFYMKMWKCMQRSETAQRGSDYSIRYDIDMDKIKFFWEVVLLTSLYF